MGWELGWELRDGWSGRPKNHTDFRPAIMTVVEGRGASQSVISAQSVSQPASRAVGQSSSQSPRPIISYSSSHSVRNLKSV